MHASDIAAVGEADFTTEEVVEILTAPNHDRERDSWVALDPEGRIVGWAYIDNPMKVARENFDAYVHPTDGREAHAVLLDRWLAGSRSARPSVACLRSWSAAGQSPARKPM